MSLHLLPQQQYSRIAGLTAPDSCGAVYPLSVLSGVQSGRVYADETGRAALIHHCCGFGFLCGEGNPALPGEAAAIIQHPQPYARMLLFAPDTQTADFFRGHREYALERRLFFRYPDGQPAPAGGEAVPITAEILAQIQGRVTPAFSWQKPADFLEKGRGFCILQDGQPAAWAFSAAVSAHEIDIGVETAERFRRRGFAFAAAAAMISDTLAQGKRPVWACSAGNAGSQKLAEALGFVCCGECETVRVIT